jgi:hypothetical protein
MLKNLLIEIVSNTFSFSMSSSDAFSSISCFVRISRSKIAWLVSNSFLISPGSLILTGAGPDPSSTMNKFAKVKFTSDKVNWRLTIIQAVVFSFLLHGHIISKVDLDVLPKFDVDQAALLLFLAKPSADSFPTHRASEVGHFHGAIEALETQIMLARQRDWFDQNATTNRADELLQG